MRLNTADQISVLAAITGLVLIVFYFAGLLLDSGTGMWLPEMIACIGGFELYMFGQNRWTHFKRRRGGDRG